MTGASGPERDADALGRLVALALAEDVGNGDWTTRWTVAPEARSGARVVAREELIVAGAEAFRAVFAALDPSVRIDLEVEEGRPAEPGTTVLRLEGPSRSILTGERTALNFLGRLSGVATLTRCFVDAVEGTGARIVDTRKTTPGWRRLEKAAVRAGGGANHRMGLWDMVLIKENHAAAAGGLARAVRAVRVANGPGLAVEVEVGDLDELEVVLPLGVDRVLLDNMTPPMLARAVRRVRGVGAGRPELEASGNVRLDTVRAIAETGVDLISVGALTHSAPAADLSLLVDP